MFKLSGVTPRRLISGLALLWCLGLVGGTLPAASADVPDPGSPDSFRTPPLHFEANVGQVPAPVQFLARGPGYRLLLTRTEAILMVQGFMTPSDPLTGSGAPHPAPLKPATLRLRYEGTDNPTSLPVGRNQLPGQSHYFLGGDPTNWHTHVPQYAQVAYPNLYPGIDLIYYGRAGQLEYDLVVAPGANPDSITLTIDGADTLKLTPEGELEIQTAVGTVRQHKPVIYQEHEGIKTFIPGTFRVTQGNRISFVIEAYDATRPLFIDPVLSYATYVESDGVYSLSRDASGNLYLTGAATPSTLLTDGAFQSAHQGFRDVFVTKLDATGTTVLYSTYLGGELDDLGRDIAVDATGRATVVGISSSADFPTANAIQGTHGGSYDVVVARLSANGDSLEYSTYLGGSGEDGLLRGLAVALDAQGNAYLSGTTSSADFPTLHAFQPTYGGAVDAFVAKVQGTEPALNYATYLGGANSDYGGDVAVDGDGHAYVVGTTFSTDFPVVKALQPQLGGERDLFITKLAPDGGALIYGTYLGGTAQDEGHGITVDAEGQVYFTGHTRSPNYPVVNPIQATLAGQADVLISHLDATGAVLVYSTYIGGTGRDQGLGIAIDASGQAFVTGTTASSDFPITANAAQSTPGMGGIDALVLKLSAGGSSLLYASYLGGDGEDTGQAITVNDTQSVTVAGTTISSDFPRTAPFHAAPSGGFVATLSETAPGLADLTLTMGDAPEPVEGGSTLTYTMTVTNQGPDVATGVVVTDTPSARLRVTSVSASQGLCQGVPVVCAVGTMEPGGQATIRLTGIPLAAPWTLTNRASVASDLPDPTVSNNSMHITTAVTAPAEGPMADLSLIKNDDTDPVTIGAPFTYTLRVTNRGPDPAPDVILTEILPPEVTVGTAQPSQGTCTGRRELSCRLGRLELDATARITIKVIPTTITPLVSQARVTSGATDPSPENNADTETTLVQSVPQVASLILSYRPEKSPIDADIGTCPNCTGIIRWEMSVINQGSGSPATDVVVKQVIPDAIKEEWRPSNEAPAKSGSDEEVICAPLDCDPFNPNDCIDVVNPETIVNEPLVVRCTVGELLLNQKFTFSSGAQLPPGTYQTTMNVTSSTGGASSLNSEGTIEEVEPEPEFMPAEGGGCFIATAAFGSPLAKEVQILRHFRDEYLLPNLAGQLLVRGYYYSSPPVAAYISQHPLIKEAVQMSLWPVVWWAHLTLKTPYIGIMVLLGGLMIVMSFLFWVIRPWSKRRGHEIWGNG